MRQVHRSLSIETRGKGLYDITPQVTAAVAEAGVSAGLATVYIAHTSASLLIQENADPEVLRDMERFFARLVPDGEPLFRHVEEGPDDMPAHVRSALTQTSLGIPVLEGKPTLGVWQGIFVYEHRNRPHTRKVLVHVFGE